MIYVMSDIHGEYDKYLEMLRLIAFSDADTLYILGDVIDRGPKPLELIKDMMDRPNVFPIIGNHEFMAIDVLKNLLVEVTEENCENHITTDILEKLLDWQRNGGNITLNHIKALPNEEREAILDYLMEFATLEVVDIGKRTFVLVHSGFASYDPKRDIYDYSPEEVIFIRPDYDRRVFRNKNIYVVTGHTPTFYISGKNEIYQNNNNICIDCGATFGGKLACLRLDDMKEFYV